MENALKKAALTIQWDKLTVKVELRFEAKPKASRPTTAASQNICPKKGK